MLLLVSGDTGGLIVKILKFALENIKFTLNSLLKEILSGSVS
jgi:hypothetical protein